MECFSEKQDVVAARSASASSSRKDAPVLQRDDRDPAPYWMLSSRG
jgi:hypothetical protein